MKAKGQSTWVVAGGAALVALLLIVGLLGVRPKKQQPATNESAKAQSPQVGLSRIAQATEGNRVADEAFYYDPSPLFLPTEWNANQKSLPASVLRDPGQMFQDYSSRLVFKREGLALDFPSTVLVPGKSSDVISTVDEVGRMRGMGRDDMTVEALPARGAYLEVVEVNSGRRVLAEALPRADLQVADTWRPIELLGAVNPAGLISRVSLIQGSGVDEVDDYYRDYVASVAHLGEVLPPGFYRIFVGP